MPAFVYKFLDLCRIIAPCPQPPYIYFVVTFIDLINLRSHNFNLLKIQLLTHKILANCILSDNIMDYHNVSQGKTTIPNVDDGEECVATDVRI